MPVYVLENEMPADELRMWQKYFDARPVGWREDNRTAKLMAIQGMKQKASDIFPSLKGVEAYEESKSDREVMNQSLKGSVFGMKLAAALGTK